MKLPFRIVLVNSGLAIILSFFFISIIDSYFLSFGLVSFWGGVIDLIVGLFLLIKKDKRYAQGFLLSAGLLILVGFIVCTSAWSFN